jgi:hypothetical protein
MQRRLEDLKKRHLEFLIFSDDIKWLIDVAESAIMTRNMLKACIGKPIDDTATIFLDKVFEGGDDE